jgi:hypothetical protein
VNRIELEKLLTLPEHKIVEVIHGRRNQKVILRCSIPLNYVEVTIDEITETRLGRTIVVIPGETPSSYEIGEVINVLTKPPTEPVGWVVQKVDFTSYDEVVNQEIQIESLNLKLDTIWKKKDGTTKLDVLYDELIAEEQAAAEIDDAELNPIK